MFNFIEANIIVNVSRRLGARTQNKKKRFRCRKTTTSSASLALMEEPGYQFPKALNKVDWALIIAIPIVSVALLVIGEFL